MEGTLKVTPEKLIASAQSFSASAGSVQNLTGNMVSTIHGLANVWSGEAAQMYYAKVDGLQESIDKMIRMISEHATDLQAMAQVYQEVEKSNQSAATALNVDIIV